MLSGVITHDRTGFSVREDSCDRLRILRKIKAAMSQDFHDLILKSRPHGGTHGAGNIILQKDDESLKFAIGEICGESPNGRNLITQVQGRINEGIDQVGRA